MGTYSAALTSSSINTCVRCATGSFTASVASSNCELCPADTWQDLQASDAKSQQCQRCPRNSSSVVTGAFNVSSCVCEAGFRHADGSFDASGAENADAHGCVHCDTGNYCPGLGASFTCELNTWSGVGVNPGPCIACATNSFAMSAAGMRAADMCQCVAGAEGLADSNCSLCAAGSFQPCDFSHEQAHAAEHSAACAALFFSMGERSEATVTRCELCPANFYSDSPGTESCAACPDNASSASGSDSRLFCRCNTSFTGEDGDEFATCPADSFCNGVLTHPCRLYTNSPADSDSADDCVCKAGFYSRNSTSSCLKCAVDTYCPGGQTVNLCAFKLVESTWATSHRVVPVRPGHLARVRRRPQRGRRLRGGLESGLFPLRRRRHLRQQHATTIPRVQYVAGGKRRGRGLRVQRRLLQRTDTRERGQCKHGSHAQIVDFVNSFITTVVQSSPLWHFVYRGRPEFLVFGSLIGPVRSADLHPSVPQPVECLCPS